MKIRWVAILAQHRRCSSDPAAAGAAGVRQRRLRGQRRRRSTWWLSSPWAGSPCRSPTKALMGAQGYLRRGNETGVLPHLWTTRVARWVPVVGVTLFELAQMLMWTVIDLGHRVARSRAGSRRVSLLSIPVILLSFIGFSGIGLAMGGAGLVIAAVARAQD